MLVSFYNLAMFSAGLWNSWGGVNKEALLHATVREGQEEYGKPAGEIERGFLR